MANPERFDADPYPTFHSDADADPDLGQDLNLNFTLLEKHRFKKHTSFFFPFYLKFKHLQQQFINIKYNF